MPNTNRKNELLHRVYVVMFAFCLFALAIVAKAVQVAVIDADKWLEKKEERYVELRPLETQRGNIYADDAQSLLATSVEFFDISMDPLVVKESVFNEGINELSDGLAELFPKKNSETWKQYIVSARAKKSQYIVIAKHVDHLKLEKLKELPIFELGQYSGGLIKRPYYRREKPYRGLASRTIGEDREKRRVGLEHSFHRLLRGEEKKIWSIKMNDGLYIPMDDPTDFEIIKGRELVTTINVEMQDIVHNELKRGIEEHNGEGGTAILMEVSTGRIKAISNLSYNKSGVLGEFDNYGVAHRSEPGSTMKAASVLALLEDDLLSSESVIDFYKGKKKFYDHWMYDSGAHGYQKSTLKEAFEISSNVAIANAMDEHYTKTKKWTHYAETLRRFGLHQTSGVELDGEPKPFIKHPKKNEWYLTTIPWMAHGYEMEMTPLQVLRFYNAIANDGRLVDAQLVTSIRSEGKVEKEFAPKVRKDSIASIESIRELQSMMEGVVARGTGKNLKSKHYDFAGKTGTTKVGYAGDGEVKYNASFAGYWPAKNPKYSMIVVVYGLKGKTYYGNRVAGPVFKRVLDWCFAIENDEQELVATVGDFKGDYTGEVHGHAKDYETIFEALKVRYKPSGRWIKGRSGTQGEVINGKAGIKRDVVPNLAGMGLRDAVYVLENLGMNVEIDGVGKIAKQSLKPGTKIKKRDITLYLN